ncbi:hypothetical protein F2S73_19400 [Pseudomonas syringae pv. actinidiae]|nr:hypothetical protein [Pseudomonas syringae pv. actinidiae]NVL35639.1 hypothetical protein [Pseudomonas syringae pv. actinidiae]NVL41105.1 hypothetical protein [Pseudomonas syringae pv. actinidiae]NVL45823.1 hypothetical protein [Pseudomonas syringae pv. actinidiae]
MIVKKKFKYKHLFFRAARELVKSPVIAVSKKIMIAQYCEAANNSGTVRSHPLHCPSTPDALKQTRAGPH